MTWPKVKIGDLVESVSKWNPKVNPSAPSFTYIDLSSIDKEKKLIHEVTIVLPNEAPSRARQLVQENDILVSTVRPNLNGVAMVEPEYDGATASTGYCVLRPNPEKIIPSFLFHWVKTPHFISEMTRNSTGANYPAVSDKTVKEHLISLPPIDEQKRIAAILDKANGIKSATQHSTEIRNGFIKSIFLEMFGDPRVQSNYTRKKFSEVAKIMTGATPSTNHPEYYGGDVPFVKPPDLCGQVIYKAISSLTSQGASKVRLIPKNSVMVSCIGILGKTALTGTSLCTNQQINSLIFNEEIIRPLFGFHYCSFIGELLDSMAPATTVPLVNKSRFSEIEIPMPPMELQLQFEKICIEFGSNITHNEQVNKLVNSITQEMLT
jgi:type I restriction enzyme, S subunit